jgi:hypothetical protein
VPRLVAFLLLLICSVAQAAPGVAINGVRLWSAPDNTRLVFDTSASARHQVFTLHAPERLVLDIPEAKLTAAAKAGLPAGGLVQSIRSARRDNKDLRIVIDLARPVKVEHEGNTANNVAAQRAGKDTEIHQAHAVSLFGDRWRRSHSPREAVT